LTDRPEGTAAIAADQLLPASKRLTNLEAHAAAPTSDPVGSLSQRRSSLLASAGVGS
jgi:hypothetical protein